jgi:acyl-CoA synthetase (NDP forming)
MDMPDMAAETIAALLAAAHAASTAALDESTGKRLLEHVGIAVPRGVRIQGPDEVDAAITGLHLPVALKIVSPDLLHKSDAGGVAINLGSAQSAKEAMAAMLAVPAIQAARVDGFLLEEMAPAGQEVVIGAIDDAQFGPMIMVGLGGIFVEVLGDVAFRICPITRLDAMEMLAELKGAPLFKGVRGQPPLSEPAIVDALLKLGGEDGLLMRYPGEFKEIDVNPLIVSATRAVAVDARFILHADVHREAAVQTVAAAAGDDELLSQYAPLFHPRTVAVVGASAKGGALPNVFMRRLRAYGYDGALYAIHPSAKEIDGIVAYPSLADTPEPVDYAYIAVSAAQVPAMLGGAAGRTRFAQVMSSGFGEVETGHELQAQLVAAARAGGMRLIGPNCLGLYSPRGKMTFTEAAPREAGPVGIVSQSGGLGTDIIRRGVNYGLRFSGLVTVGNCADVQPSELLAYFLADPGTRVIGIYIESARDGRRLFELLRAAAGAKPVVVLKGGRTAQGRAAAASHTGALAGDARAWAALSRQTGCVLVDTLDQFLEALLVFQTLQPHRGRPTERVALFGNGGGTSVLATDYFAQLGLNVERFPAQAVTALDALNLPPGTSVANPVDAPMGTIQQDEGRVAERILDIMCSEGRPDALVIHLNMAVFVGRVKPEVLDNTVAGALRVKQRHPGTHFLLVLRSDGDPAVEARKREFRGAAVATGLPVYDEMSNAGHALAALRQHEHFLGRSA